MNYPSFDDLIKMHDLQILFYGDEYGILDEGKLKSCLENPLGSFGGSDFYPGVIKKASRLCFNICMNHPFVDGNKRTGAQALESTLKINGINLLLTDKELLDLILSLVKHKIDFDDFFEIINSKCEFIEESISFN